MYKQALRDKQKFKIQKAKETYDPVEVRKYIDPYIKLLDRNAKSMRARCLELADAHAAYIPIDQDRDYDLMGTEEKIDALFELYDAGTNQDNADREIYKGQLDAAMHGRIMNPYQSYDYLDNDKYKRIEKLLDIMQETFGFAKGEDVESLVTGGNEEVLPEVQMADLPRASKM